jgi:aminoglycoside phosphotransferase
VSDVPTEPGRKAEAAEFVAKSLGVRPLAMTRQQLSSSGNVVYRADLPKGNSVVVRANALPNTFAFTGRNLKALRVLGLPVQSVLATGRTTSGGSFIILNWLPGSDLVHELHCMTRAQMTRLAEQVVDYQRRLALLPKSEGFGWAPVGQNGPRRRWSEVFGGKLSPTEADDGTQLGSWRARLCQIRSRLEPYFDWVRPNAFLDDLTTKNLLVENGILSGMIDIDFICYGDPLLAVGATMASIAADVAEDGTIYGEELVRLWHPNTTQRKAIWFYAALWTVGAMSMSDSTDAVRTARLGRAAQLWLDLAERQPALIRSPHLVARQLVSSAA